MSYVGLYDDCGSRNTFYVLKNRKGVGFKSFENKEKAEFARRVQSKLAEDNLAPRVYSVVGRIMIPSDYDTDEMTLSNWGYVTEIAKPMPECYDDDCDGDCCGTGCENSITIENVVNCLDESGLEYIDGHRGNFGFVRRNRKWIAVVIDVGIESFGDWDDRIYGGFDDSYEDSGCDCSMCREAREAI